jgi:hypothetical protein
MKIYDNEKQVVFEGELNFKSLDFNNANCSEVLLIPIVDENLKVHMADVAYNHMEDLGWCDGNVDKLNVYLYIDLIADDFKPYIQVEVFPYLPPENELRDKFASYEKGEERLYMEGYYEEVKEYLNKNTGGEFITLNIELNPDEKATLLELLPVY